MAKLAGLNPQAIAQKLVNAVGAAGNNYINGTAAVQVAPGQLAANNQQGYLSGVQANVQKWADKVSGVTLGAWQLACKTKGAPRLAQGIQAAMNKIVQFWTNWMPVLQAAQTTVRAMPKATFADRMARMNQMANILHMQGGKRGQ